MSATPSPTHLYAHHVSYDPDDVMRETFFEDCYLFDLAQNGRIVAARAPHARMRLGESFFSLVSAKAQAELTDYLLSYQQAPFITETEAGIAIVLPTLMPDTALGIALIPHADRNSILHRLSKEKNASLVFSESLTDRGDGRVRYGAPLARVDRLLQMIDDCFDTSPLPPRTTVEVPLERRLFALSRFSGCPLHLSRSSGLMHYGELNMGLFTAFGLLSLLLCRDASVGREAFFALDATEAGISVSCRIPNPSTDLLNRWEVVWLNFLADRKRLIFECTPLTNQLHLRLVPMDVDWAHLGLKQPPNPLSFLAGEGEE